MSASASYSLLTPPVPAGPAPAPSPLDGPGDGFPAGWALSVHLGVACSRRGLSVGTIDDLLPLFPKWFRESDSPVRDAIVEALLVVLARREGDTAADIASSDPAYAFGPRLDYIARHLGLARSSGENDRAFRARLLRDDEIATPEVVMRLVADVLAPVSDAPIGYWELPADGVFLRAVDDASRTTDGTYLGDVPTPIVSVKRRYDARPGSLPRYPILLGGFRSEATGTSRSGEDYYTAINPRVVIVALPSLGVPGVARVGSPIVRALPSTFVDAGTGELNDEASFVAEHVGVIDECYVFEFAKEPLVVADTVRGVLDRALAFGAQHRMIFDPAVAA